jgi:hypothetical protein
MTYADLSGAADAAPGSLRLDDEKDLPASNLRTATVPTVSSLRTPARQPKRGYASAPREAGAPAVGLSGARWRDFVAGLLPWAEQRFARRVSNELLALYRTVSAKDARLRGRDLYRAIVMARERIDPQSAEALLDRAEQSYATWPTPRAVVFSDVVHYIAVSEFLASQADGHAPWIKTDMRREVESRIPDNL